MKIHRTGIAGFTLVEVLIAMGVAFISLYGLTTVTQTSLKAQKNVEATAAADNAITNSKIWLSKGNNCLTALGTTTLSAPPQTGQSITPNLTAAIAAGFPVPQSTPPTTWQLTNGQITPSGTNYNGKLGAAVPLSPSPRRSARKSNHNA